MSPAELLPDSAMEQLGSLGAAVDAAEQADVSWRDRVHIHVLRNFTLEPLEPWLKYHLMRAGIAPRISFGGYDTMSQEILDPASALNREPPDIIMLSVLIDLLVADAATLDERQLSQVRERLTELVQTLLERTNALLMLHRLPPPIAALLAGADAQAPALAAVNDRLAQLAREHPQRIVITDWAAYLEDPAAAIDRRFWKSSQAPFRGPFLNACARDLARLVRAWRGHAKKCLILDCDNTLWGGVVGEDGVDGVALHPDKEPGTGFYRLQQSVLELIDQGIMVALCSKNNEADVWELIDSHPHCLLKKEHLVAWRINWDDKASNIRALADELNIGIDSMVFVDDSPQECGLVTQMLPEVTVLRVPEDLAAHSDLLTRDGLFDRLAHSNEDRRRTRMYQDEAQRRDAQAGFQDLTAYLQSLETVASIRPPRADELARVAQLTQKTNQFNLTTRRYTDADILAFADADDTALYSLSVRDRFGDLGLVGVLIVHRAGTTGRIDTLLLSCRALSRQVEFAFIDQAMTALEQAWQLTDWEAQYIPTKKNAQTADFWDRAGFSPAGEGEGEDGTVYRAPAGQRPQDYLDVMSIELE
ncbi:MAG: HAD-IIIC family phosphatase [Gammaproteobacteria bacterium]|nr:HAD-IIIC family phosphatase [Gammaproteobacteria bacterium]NNL99127.1 HAD-IIIC family phosphatase [Gammaproteobacteria bacterium]